MRRWTYYTKGFSMMLIVVSILGLGVAGCLNLSARQDRINDTIITITIDGQSFKARYGSFQARRNGWFEATDLSTGQTIIFSGTFTITGAPQ